MTDHAEKVEQLATDLLHKEPDPVKRWHLAAETRAAVDTAMTRVQAVSAAQAIADGNNMEDVAAEVGLTRQRLSDVLKEHGAPRPRSDQAFRESPQFRLGAYCGLLDLWMYRQHAGAAGRAHNMLDKHLESLLPSGALRLHQLDESVRVWRASSWAKSSVARSAWWASRLDAARGDVEELPLRALSAEEQMWFWMGHGKARKTARDEWGDTDPA